MRYPDYATFHIVIGGAETKTRRIIFESGYVIVVPCYSNSEFTIDLDNSFTFQDFEWDLRHYFLAIICQPYMHIFSQSIGPQGKDVVDQQRKPFLTRIKNFSERLFGNFVGDSIHL